MNALRGGRIQALSLKSERCRFAGSKKLVFYIFQFHSECTAFSGAAHDGKLPAHLFHQPLGNCQAKAGPFVNTSSPGAAVLNEWLEYLRYLFRRNSNPRIGDVKSQRAAFGFSGKVEYYGNAYSSAMSKFQGIARQVQQDLPDSQIIQIDNRRQVRISNLQREILFYSFQPENADDFPD